MLHVVESKKSLQQIAVDLERAVTRHGFGVMGVVDLRESMAKKGVAFARECRVFEVCNPLQAKKVLETNVEFSTALPCRISLYEEAGGTRLATLKPTALVALFPGPGLEGTAREVEATLISIMDEAAR